ncbi:MAG: hypothetical protein A2545_02170 [Planctomycetes bacterium RIFOXYD2_FULL_41_16]|nr:MAG: hypothetical protein A2069_03100 [Planctomycetes bacterium GWB2_41_19]OHC07496.1 MAG: hypothetical protein A2545_02170 [Planctomycetes bacterium RIFOXYD2_FULL_41_16]
MNKKKVALVKGEDRKENIKKCLTLIREDLEPIKNAGNILIKPNLVALKPDFANTNVEAIEAVIEFIREIVPDTHITVGESSATAFYRGLPTTSVFKDYDYYRLEKKYKKVSLIHFDDDGEFIQSPILSVVGDTHLRITKRAREFDYKISLAIPKTHNFAIATFGIKNMAGLVIRQDMAMIHGMKGGIEIDAPKTLLDKLPPGTVSKARRTLPNWLINFLFRQYPAYRKSVKMIHRNIVEFAKRLWPALVVLDGYVCMEGDGPVDGTSVLMKTAIASADPVKADGVGARLIGFEPEEIGYLYYLQNEEKMGEYSLENLVGDDLKQLRRSFKRHGTYDIQSRWR